MLVDFELIRLFKYTFKCIFVCLMFYVCMYYLNVFTFNMCLRIYLWLVDHISYHQLLFAGLSGYPVACVYMWVVAGSPQGMRSGAKILRYKKWQLYSAGNRTGWVAGLPVARSQSDLKLFFQLLKPNGSSVWGGWEGAGRTWPTLAAGLSSIAARILKHRCTCGSGCQKDLCSGVFRILRCLRSAFVPCVIVVVARATHARFSKNMLNKVRSEGNHFINMLTIIVFCEDFGL